MLIYVRFFVVVVCLCFCCCCGFVCLCLFVCCVFVVVVCFCVCVCVVVLLCCLLLRGIHNIPRYVQASSYTLSPRTLLGTASSGRHMRIGGPFAFRVPN